MSKSDGKKGKCFVIMPITTPADRGYKLQNHFAEVYAGLIAPAIKIAGYEPVRPQASGSELIHSKIVSELVACEMVLCDASSLNANVFYELGVRTALNKPVAMIVDKQTKLPFDTSFVHHFLYNSELSFVEQTTRVEELAEHIRETEASDNAMWKAFGMSAQGASKGLITDNDDESRLDYLTKIVESISKDQKAFAFGSGSRFTAGGGLISPGGGFLARNVAQHSSSQGRMVSVDVTLKSKPAREEKWQILLILSTMAIREGVVAPGSHPWGNIDEQGVLHMHFRTDRDDSAISDCLIGASDEVAHVNVGFLVDT